MNWELSDSDATKLNQHGELTLLMTGEKFQVWKVTCGNGHRLTFKLFDGSIYVVSQGYSEPDNSFYSPTARHPQEMRKVQSLINHVRHMSKLSPVSVSDIASRAQKFERWINSDEYVEVVKRSQGVVGKAKERVRVFSNTVRNRFGPESIHPSIRLNPNAVNPPKFSRR